MSFNPDVKVLSNVSVAAGATVTSDPIKMDYSLSQIIIYPVNTGASENLTINIYSSPDGILKSLLMPATLDTTTRLTNIPVTVVPAYLIFEAINGDASNATTYDVIVSKRA